MSEEIIKVLNYIGEQLGIAIDWTSENVWPQVLDIFGRYRILQLISCSIWMAVCIGAAVVLSILWTKVIKAYHVCQEDRKDNFWWDNRSYGVSMSGYAFSLTVITCFCGAGIIVALIGNVSELLQWALVPEIQFLELLKGYMG